MGMGVTAGTGMEAGADAGTVRPSNLAVAVCNHMLENKTVTTRASYLRNWDCDCDLSWLRVLKLAVLFQASDGAKT